MGIDLAGLSWARLALVVALLYLPWLAFYRLYWHPLARFPGPPLAALTRWYEAYYDVVCGGHPCELHVNDPAFYKQLYTQDGRWDKYGWATAAFGAPTATLHTLDSYQHKRRRAALNPFFSKANVNHRVIGSMTEKLCRRLSALPSGETINLGNAISALTRDIATEVLIGGSFNHLEADDFHAELATLQQNGGEIWRTTKHIRWFGPLMQSLPLSVVEKLGDKGLLNFLSYIEWGMMKITQDILSQFQASGDEFSLGKGEHAPTIVHQVLASDLPPSDKAFEHLSEEVMTVTSAGMETTANSLRVTTYHIFNSPDVLRHLREELTASSVDLSDLETKDGAHLATLEASPYLTAVLMEGLRLSTPIASRSQRIAPDRELQYRQWRIPAGTPVGMTLLLMHRDENLYPEPSKFDPGRWLDTWAEIYIVIATLVQRFDLQFDGVGLLDVEPVSDKWMAATARQNGFKALVTPRL
ncbi:Uu.00g008010.m01.CDS01 [Anthostomella pinea]|uniref:Uu.00g008010.m01.CDS01 n=1 Tax=Anthostomella pinea TaxID=933095 RepID=A0AAI8VX33_9PEZI|nr:Uu.00g008010.m01.CDS01 [Anthostomella pinea]